MRIAGLFDHSRACRNLRLAFRSGTDLPFRVHLEFLSSWKELREGVRQGSYDLAFVQPCLGQPSFRPEPRLSELEQVVAFLPRDQVILYLCRPHPSATLLYDLGRLGFPFLLMLGVDDDLRGILRIVARARARDALQKGLADLLAELDERTLRLALDALAGWPPPSSVKELAENLNTSRRSLSRKLQTVGLPSPGRLRSTGTLLEARTLWGMGVQSRARIASILGLADPASLSRLSRRLAGRPLSTFLEAESGEDLVDWMVRQALG